jgi:hypothetical protein
MKLSLCMTSRHSGQWTYSSTHSQSQHCSIWAVCFTPHPPVSTEQKAGWEPELGWTLLWNRWISVSWPGIKPWSLSCPTCSLLNISTMLCYASSICFHLKAARWTVWLISLPWDSMPGLMMHMKLMWPSYLNVFLWLWNTTTWFWAVHWHLLG